MVKLVWHYVNVAGHYIHVAVAGGVAEAVLAAKASNTGFPVQVEVDRIDQIEPALEAGADRLLLDNMADWPAFNKVYVTYFPDGKFPARSAFGADGLALGALLEVECWAYAGPK